MFVATLIAAPASVGLDRALVSEVSKWLGGGQQRWLGEGMALEFATPDQIVLPKELADALNGARVDYAFQPAAGRRKRMLIADMDSTLIQQECIDEMAAAVGVGEEVATITKKAMNGEIDFNGALIERVALMKGQSATIIDDVLLDRITLMPGGDALVATMRANGAYTALVSGGFTQFSGVISERLGFDEHRANRLIIEDGVLTGTVAEPILGRDAKVTAFNEITARLGLSSNDVLAVGDGANDIGMLQAAGLGVALHAKPAVRTAAGFSIDHGDLSALLYLQGYSEDEWVWPNSG